MWIGALAFGAYGALMVWTAVAFAWIAVAPGGGGLGAVSTSVGPHLLLPWIAGIAVNRMVVARARAAGGMARRLHKSHLVMAFVFAAIVIATLFGLVSLTARFDSRVFIAAVTAASAIFALHFIVLAVALALLARWVRPVEDPSA